MDEQFPVFRLTQDAYNQLLLVASESPDIYLNPEADFHAILTERGFSDYTEETGIFSSLLRWTRKTGQLVKWESCS